MCLLISCYAYIFTVYKPPQLSLFELYLDSWEIIALCLLCGVPEASTSVS
jgi:hypothetical protein